MQATLAQQLTIFSFGAVTFMLTLVALIAFVSILRLIRIEKLEFARAMYVPQQNPSPQPTQTAAPEETQRRSPLPKSTSAHIDIQIDPAEQATNETRYKPRSVPNIKAG